MAKKRPTAFRIREDVLAAIDKDAFRRRLSRNHLVNLILEGYIEQPFEKRRLPSPLPARGRKPTAEDILA